MLDGRVSLKGYWKLAPGKLAIHSEAYLFVLKGC